MLLFAASNPASITSPLHNWVLLLLWLHPFILSGVISPLISSSILGTHQPGEFMFQCPIFLPFHTVHGVLKARILKWFVIPFSIGPHSVRPLHHDPPVLGCPAGMAWIRHTKCGWLQPCRSSREELPHVQGKRNPSKRVGTERGQQRADRLKLQSQTTSQSNHMHHSLV